MPIVYAGVGAHAGYTGVLLPSGSTTWYTGAPDLFGLKSSIGNKCYCLSTGEASISVFDIGTWVSYNYPPVEFALSSLYGDSNTGRVYFVVNSVPLSVHSTVDFVSWDIAPLPINYAYFGEAAMGPSGFYVGVFDSPFSGTARVYKATSGTALSLELEVVSLPSFTGHIFSVSFLEGVLHYYYQTSGEGVYYGRIDGEVTCWDDGLGNRFGYHIDEALSPMCGSDGVYVMYTDYASNVTDLRHSFSGTAGSFQASTISGLMSGPRIITQNGIVCRNPVTFDAYFVSGGTIVETLPSYAYSAVYGATSYTPPQPFWTNYVGCVERT